jgi:hypothetical protein
VYIYFDEYLIRSIPQISMRVKRQANGGLGRKSVIVSQVPGTCSPSAASTKRRHDALASLAFEEQVPGTFCFESPNGERAV